MFATLLVLILIVGLVSLWTRVSQLEQRLAFVEDRGNRPFPDEPESQWGTPPPLPAIDPAPVAPAPRPFSAPAPEPQWIMEPVRLPPARQPEPQREPEPEPEPLAEPERGSFGLEELFGRRLPIWAGGVTLAVAGVLIVRYSIESGLLSPPVRVLLGLLFGGGLIAGAELALRFEHRVRDRRVSQALAGAGIASLYASILVATNLYALIDPFTGFVGLAAVTAAALLLSIRFGPPSALLGLVGGLAAPALVGAEQPNVPLLTVYLALAVGGLSVLSQAQRWAWLGVSALVGGLGWGLVLILGGMLDEAASMPVGLYLLLIGVAVPAVAAPASASGQMLRMAGSLAAAAQIAVLVATGGFSLLHWGLFGLISAAIVRLAQREQGLARLPVIGLALALLLIGIWPLPSAEEYALVLFGTALIYGGPALFRLWRPGGGVADACQIAAIALGGALLAVLHFARSDRATDEILAVVSLGLALVPAAAAMLGWRSEQRDEDGRFALLVSTSALLAGIAAALAVPIEMLPLVIGAIGTALLLLSRVAEDERIELSAWAAAAVTLPLLVAASRAVSEAARLFGKDSPPDPTLGALRWAGLAAVGAVYAWRARIVEARRFAQGMAALLAYGAAAQITPAELLPLVPAAALLALAMATRGVGARLLPGLAVTFGIAVAWSVQPFAHWSVPALASLVGEPLLVTDLPPVADALLRLLVPAAMIGGAAWLVRGIRAKFRQGAAAVALLLGASAMHILFKQLFGLASTADFIAYGMGERLLWQSLLAAGAVTAWLVERPRAPLMLAGAALAHLCWYSLLLHNPLWATQAVGSAPVFNLVIGTYGLALALLAFADRAALLPTELDRPRTALRMVLIVLFAYSALRQLAHGSLLVAPGLTQGEDILRSILAVALAVGFLLWGMRTGSRDWRIGSLVLMLAAVVKVFLFDAAGLEGLLRIASFVALGGSLIGIGWLYSRSLRSTPLTEAQ